MAAAHGQMKCKIYPSAFSGEVVFQVDTVDGQSFEGIAPKHYVASITQPIKDVSDGQLKEGVDGQLKVRVLSNKRKITRVRLPDEQILNVSADKVVLLVNKT